MTGQPNFKREAIKKDLDFISLLQEEKRKINGLDGLIALAEQQPTNLYRSCEK
jgi:hypothetical protein